MRFDGRNDRYLWHRKVGRGVPTCPAIPSRRNFRIRERIDLQCLCQHGQNVGKLLAGLDACNDKVETFLAGNTELDQITTFRKIAAPNESETVGRSRIGFD